jgi:hypothetical protein
METTYFCKERKCTKRMQCARYIEGLRNKFNKQPDKVPKRDIKNCEDYELFNRTTNQA